MSKKIIFSVLVAFLISFSLLFAFLNYYKHHNDLDKLENKFYSQNFDSEKKKVILLLGSSQTGALNATYINQHITSNCCIVYNLAIAADRPQKRLDSVNRIISIRPDLILYGIGFMEFENEQMNVFNKPKSFLPDPEKLSRELFDKFHFPDFESPKFVTLNIIRNLGQNPDNSKELVFDQYTPFFPYDIKKQSSIKSDFELKNYLKITAYNEIESLTTNKDTVALKEIIHRLQMNNIKVVVFTSPFNEYYLDNMPDSYNSFLDDFIKNITQEYNIKIIPLQDRYDKMKVWNDLTHIAVNENVTIYNDDIVKIIMYEMRD